VKLSVTCVCVCVCVCVIYSYVSMVFHSKKCFEPMIVQVQDFLKDVNAQCNVLNIRQPVLQVITVLCLEF